MLYVDIKKKLGDFILDIEFETNGQTLALLGSSGSGKSMTLACVAGVETPDKGRIVLNNRVLFDSKKRINLLPRQRKVGLLFQNYALFPNMTLKENLAVGIPKKYKDKVANEKSIAEKIKAFSLEGLENNYPHQLSGGQQQRVALARMLLNEPEILMFDEPFSALDEHLRWKMEKELISLLKEHNKSALYVSHNRDEVYRICSTVAVLNNGTIEELKEKDNLFAHPETINTAILTGCKNTSPIKRISKNKLLSTDWDLELNCSKDIDDDIEYVGVRALDIKICDDKVCENTFELNIVDRIENISSPAILLSKFDKKVKAPNSEIYVYVTREEFNDLKSKEKVFVHLKPDTLLLLKEKAKYDIKKPPI